MKFRNNLQTLFQRNTGKLIFALMIFGAVSVAKLPVCFAETESVSLPKSLPKKDALASSSSEPSVDVASTQVVAAPSSMTVAVAAEKSSLAPVDVMSASPLPDVEQQSPDVTIKNGTVIAKSNSTKKAKKLKSAKEEAEASDETDPENGGDVYNFYFQKAPGPSSVIQGSEGANGAAAASTTPPPGNPASSNSPSGSTSANYSSYESASSNVNAPLVYYDPQAVNQFKRLGVGIGLGTMSVSDFNSYTGYVYSGELNLNDYFGLEAGLFVGSASSESRLDGDRSARNTQQSSVVQTYVGAILKPIEVKIFGSSVLGLGLIGGWETVPVTTSRCYYVSSSSSCGSGQYLSSDSKFVPYFGTAVNWYFSKSFGMQYEFRSASYQDRRYSTSVVGFMVRF